MMRWYKEQQYECFMTGYVKATSELRTSHNKLILREERINLRLLIVQRLTQASTAVMIPSIFVKTTISDK